MLQIKSAEQSPGVPLFGPFAEGKSDQNVKNTTPGIESPHNENGTVVKQGESEVTRGEVLVDPEKDSVSDSNLNETGGDQETQPAITSPEEIPVETIQKHTAVLHDVSKSQHVKIYDKAAAFIDLPADDYTEDNLLLGTQLTKEFIVTRVMVRTSAVGLATQYKINEGRLMGKVLDIHDTVFGTGREEYADEVFPYPKATRCMYIRISKIGGVDAYTFLGTECLRKVATAIEKSGVDGPDQIAALFAKYDEQCDMSLGHKEFKIKLNSILKQVLEQNKLKGQEDSQTSGTGGNTANTLGVENSGSEDNLETSGSGDEDSGGLNDLATSSSDDEDSASDDDFETLDCEDEDSQDEDDLKPSDGDDEDPAGDDGLEPSDDADESSIGADDLKTSSSKKTEKDATKKLFLNQESVNITLTNFVKSAKKLLKMTPPKEKLDMILFDEARVCLESLELYVNGASSSTE